jgi:hypothetical protein
MEKNIVDIQCVIQILVHTVEIPWILVPQSKIITNFQFEFDILL